MTNTVTKVKRFYPLDAVKATSILLSERDKLNTYSVRYYDRFWHIRELNVVAVDEVGAFSAAIPILKSKQREPWEFPMMVGGYILATVVAFVIVSLIVHYFRVG